MTEERRTVRVDSYFTPTEFEMLQEKMAEAGVSNMSAFLRKMALDGFMVRLRMDEIKEMNRLLGLWGNNVNQIARRVNGTGHVYDADLEEIRRGQVKIWASLKRILRSMEKLE